MTRLGRRSPPGAMGATALLGIQRAAGNRAATTLALGASPAVQRSPGLTPAQKQKIDKRRAACWQGLEEQEQCRRGPEIVRRGGAGQPGRAQGQLRCRPQALRAGSGKGHPQDQDDRADRRRAQRDPADDRGCRVVGHRGQDRRQGKDHARQGRGDEKRLRDDQRPFLGGLGRVHEAPSPSRSRTQRPESRVPPGSVASPAERRVRPNGRPNWPSTGHTGTSPRKGAGCCPWRTRSAR